MYGTHVGSTDPGEGRAALLTPCYSDAAGLCMWRMHVTASHRIASRRPKRWAVLGSVTVQICCVTNNCVRSTDLKKIGAQLFFGVCVHVCFRTVDGRAFCEQISPYYG